MKRSTPLPGYPFSRRTKPLDAYLDERAAQMLRITHCTRAPIDVRAASRDCVQDRDGGSSETHLYGPTPPKLSSPFSALSRAPPQRDADTIFDRRRSFWVAGGLPLHSFRPSTVVVQRWRRVFLPHPPPAITVMLITGVFVGHTHCGKCVALFRQKFLQAHSRTDRPKIGPKRKLTR